MAISKILYKASASASAEVWMDATPATASAADITSPKSAMLANGVVTVGSASDGIIGEDNVIYNARAASSSVGTANRGYEQIIGGTVCWNQKLKNIEFMYDTNWTKTTGGSLSVSENILTHELRQTNNVKNLWGTMDTVKSGHVVFISFWWNEVCSDNGSLLYFRYALKSGQDNVLSDDQILSPSSFTSDTWYFEQAIVQPDTDIGYFSIGCRSSTSDRTISLKLKSPQVIDLTQLFGETIANYISTLETATAGAGVAFFRKLFSSPNYTYNPGQFAHVCPSAHKIINFNLYNPSASSSTLLLDGEQYQITGTYTSLSFSPTNGTSEIITPDASGYFTPANRGLLTVNGGDSTTTCVHLVKDGSRDNEWEAYTEHIYSIANPQLKGVMKLDQNNNLYYDGDIYKSDGFVTRRFMYAYINEDGDLVLPNGLTRSWSGNISSNYVYLILFSNSGEIISNGPCFCSMYEHATVFGDDNNDKCVYPFNSGGNTRLLLRDTSISGWTSATTGAELATAVKTYFAEQYALGNYFEIIFEVTNPTTEYVGGFMNPQIINKFSTEIYTDYLNELVDTSDGARDVAIPVGHNTQYFNTANPAKLTF